MFLGSYDFRSSAREGPFSFTLSAGAADWKVSKVTGPKSSFCALIANIRRRAPLRDHLSTIMGKIHAPWALGGVPLSNLRVGVFASRGDLSESTTGRFVMNEKSCPKTFFIIGFLFTTL
jgi:hypothetical protein